MNLAAGAAGAGVAHGPEIVFFAEAFDPLFRHADLSVPDVVSFVVVQVDRDPEFVFRQAVAVGEQVPSEVNRLFLEVIAEGEVAEHFEKRVMPGRIADVFQVVVLPAGPHAFLGGRCPVVPAFLLSEEGAFELNHAGVGKQQRRVVLRHEGRTPDHLVPVLFEII